MDWDIAIERSTKNEAKQAVADALPKRAKRVGVAIEHLLNHLPASLDNTAGVSIVAKGRTTTNGRCVITISIEALAVLPPA